MLLAVERARAAAAEAEAAHLRQLQTAQPLNNSNTLSEYNYRQGDNYRGVGDYRGGSDYRGVDNYRPVDDYKRVNNYSRDNNYTPVNEYRGAGQEGMHAQADSNAAVNVLNSNISQLNAALQRTEQQMAVLAEQNTQREKERKKATRKESAEAKRHYSRNSTHKRTHGHTRERVEKNDADAEMMQRNVMETQAALLEGNAITFKHLQRKLRNAQKEEQKTRKERNILVVCYLFLILVLVHSCGLLSMFYNIRLPS